MNHSVWAQTHTHTCSWRKTISLSWPLYPLALALTPWSFWACPLAAAHSNRLDKALSMSPLMRRLPACALKTECLFPPESLPFVAALFLLGPLQHGRWRDPPCRQPAWPSSFNALSLPATDKPLRCCISVHPSLVSLPTIQVKPPEYTHMSIILRPLSRETAELWESTQSSLDLESVLVAQWWITPTVVKAWTTPTVVKAWTTSPVFKAVGHSVGHPQPCDPKHGCWGLSGLKDPEARNPAPPTLHPLHPLSEVPRLAKHTSWCGWETKAWASRTWWSWEAPYVNLFQRSLQVPSHLGVDLSNLDFIHRVIVHEGTVGLGEGRGTYC